MQHQRQETANLRFLRQQFAQQPREPDGFVGKFSAMGIGAVCIFPAIAEGGINGIQHGAQTGRKQRCIRDFERDPCLTDFRLRAYQSLSHGLWCDEEGAPDRSGIQAEHHLQHQGCVHVGIDRRMGADQHEIEPLVGQGTAILPVA